MVEKPALEGSIRTVTFAQGARAGEAILCGSRKLRWRSSRNSDQEEHLKKIGLLTLLIMATLLFTLAFTVAAAAPKAPAAPVPAAAAVPAPVAAAATPEEHPHIHEALEAMRNAKHELETAAHDFHGHRVKAIEHLDQAIHEAEICEHER
jgi:hypothetical protein